MIMMLILIHFPYSILLAFAQCCFVVISSSCCCCICRRCHSLLSSSRSLLLRPTFGLLLVLLLLPYRPILNRKVRGRQQTEKQHTDERNTHTGCHTASTRTERKNNWGYSLALPHPWLHSTQTRSLELTVVA